MPAVLVADDEPTVRALVRASLESHGYDVLEAADGPSTLSSTRALRPDLVLLDIALPGMSGFEVLRGIREHPTTADTPVLLLTGLVTEQAALTGIQGIVTKPFAPAELTSRVAHALNLRPGPISSS